MLRCKECGKDHIEGYDYDLPCMECRLAIMTKERDDYRGKAYRWNMKGIADAEQITRLRGLLDDKQVTIENNFTENTRLLGLLEEIDTALGSAIGGSITITEAFLKVRAILARTNPSRRREG